VSALQWATLVLLALAAAIGMWRTWRGPSRRGLAVIAPLPMAGLLWLLLYPPLIETTRVEAVVLSAGVSTQQLAELDSRVPVYALPGVVAVNASIEVVPDLATACPNMTCRRSAGAGLHSSLAPSCAACSMCNGRRRCAPGHCGQCMARLPASKAASCACLIAVARSPPRRSSMRRVDSDSR
jgi:hypothetical protein